MSSLSFSSAGKGQFLTGAYLFQIALEIIRLPIQIALHSVQLPLFIRHPNGLVSRLNTDELLQAASAS